MSKINLLSSSIRFALVAGAVSMLAAPAIAQTPQSPDETQVLDRVEVVGTRIRQVDIETAQPVLIIQREDLQRTGLTQIGDVLQRLTSMGAGLNQTFNNGGSGSTFVDLRDLGAARTLVLVNGRRFAPDGDALSGIVDMNSIPTSIIERVEILKDGASAIYGSDAIAGVINIITVREFDGMSATAYFGQNQEGDGATRAADFTVGASTDRASLVMNFSFQENDPISAGDREISRVPQFGADFCASSTSPAGRIGLVGRPGTWTLTNPAPTAPGVVQSAANIRPFAIPADCYNFAPDNYLLTPQKRHSAYAQLRFNITDNLTFRNEFVYTNRTSDQLLAPIPVTFAGSGLFGANVRFDVAANSFFNPFGVATTRMQRRINETGGRRFSQDVDVWHYAGGLEGNFELGSRLFFWDVGYIFSQNQRNDITTGQVNIDRIRAAVGPSFRDATGVIRCGTPGAIVTGCVPLNLFGGNGSITPEMLAYISTPLMDTFEYKRTSYNANISGDLFELPAGMMAFAAGVERRDESGFDLPDALTATGASSGNIRQPTAGGFTVDETYAELAVPLLSDVTFAERLDLRLASRYSDYDTFGETTNSSIGLAWKPTADVLVRGNWAEGFRAPAISELFLGASDSFAAVRDPCAGPGQATANRFATLTPDQRARCVALGVPATGAEQASGQIRTTVGGNVNLTPETATTRTLGLVYSPEWVEGLNLSLDWYEIEIENVITGLGAQTILDACILGGASAQCALITRLPGTGAVTGLLDVAVNGASTRVEGFDFGASYLLETDYGRFALTWDNTYVSEYITVTESGIPGSPLIYSFVGTYYERGALVARLKSNFTVNWDYGDWGATWGMRYTSRMEEDCSDAVNPATQCSSPGPTPFNVDGLASNGLELVPVNELDATIYHDLQGRWTTPWNATLSAGVRNAFDQDPPVSISTFANSFDPHYDVPGRFWYMSYTQRF